MKTHERASVLPSRERRGVGPARLAGALVAAVMVAAAWAQAAQPSMDEEVRVRARVLFEEGLAAFAAQDYEAARSAFAASFALRENATVLYNLANTERALDNFPGSIASFRRYLELVGEQAPAEERAQIEALIAEMTERVVQVTIDAPEGAAIEVDDRPMGAAPLPEPVLLMPGDHLVVATLADREDARQEFRAAAGERVAVRLEPQPVAVQPPPPPPVVPAVQPPIDVQVESPAPAPEDWGVFSIGLAAGANLRAVDFEHQGFLDNFYWTLAGTVEILDWLGVGLDIVLPPVDLAAWLRFVPLRLSWFRLGVAPGFVFTTGAADDREPGFAVALAVPAEFRLYRGLVVSLVPAVGVDVLQPVVVVPLTIGVAYYL